MWDHIYRFCSAIYFFTTGKKWPYPSQSCFCYPRLPSSLSLLLLLSSSLCQKCWLPLHLQHFLFASAPLILTSLFLSAQPFGPSPAALFHPDVPSAFVCPSWSHPSERLPPKIAVVFLCRTPVKGHIFFCCISMMLLAVSVCRWCTFFQSSGFCIDTVHWCSTVAPKRDIALDI